MHAVGGEGELRIVLPPACRIGPWTSITSQPSARFETSHSE
jgi:hypothetical protein